MHVSSSDRVAAALLRIDYAEEVLRQARKILEYEDKQEKQAEPVAAPKEACQLNYIEEPVCEE